MLRDGNDPTDLSEALNTLSIAESELGDSAQARADMEEAVTLARDGDDLPQLAGSLNDLSNLESDAGNFHRAIELLDESLRINEEIGNPWGIQLARHNQACALGEIGETEEAVRLLCRLLTGVLAQNDVNLTVTYGEDLAIAVGRVGDIVSAARLLGAVVTTRARLGLPTPATQQANLDRNVAAIRASQPDSPEWDRAFTRGGDEPVEAVLSATVRAHA